MMAIASISVVPNAVSRRGYGQGAHGAHRPRQRQNVIAFVLSNPPVLVAGMWRSASPRAAFMRPRANADGSHPRPTRRNMIQAAGLVRHHPSVHQLPDPLGTLPDPRRHIVPIRTAGLALPVRRQVIARQRQEAARRRRRQRRHQRGRGDNQRHAPAQARRRRHRRLRVWPWNAAMGLRRFQRAGRGRVPQVHGPRGAGEGREDRKSTRLNSSH